MPRRRAPLLVAAALAVMLPLGGCSQLDEIFAAPTGSDVEFGSGSLPGDFPADVPLVEGEVDFGGKVTSGGEQIWNAVLVSADPNALTTIQGQFQGAGFAATEVTETAAGSAITFSRDAFTVFVLVAPQEDATVHVDYTVTQAAAPPAAFGPTGALSGATQ